MKLTPYPKIKSLLADSHITIHTFQHVKALNMFDKKNYITGQTPHSLSKIKDWKPVFARPYEWMREQMGERVDNFSGDLPIWGWIEEPGKIRVEDYFGSNQVKITASVPLSRCLISDFDLWSMAINNCFLSYDIQKMEDFLSPIDEKSKERPIQYKYVPSKEEMETSWEMIFDLHYPRSSKFREFMGIGSGGRFLQVCVDKIYFDEVESIKVY